MEELGTGDVPAEIASALAAVAPPDPAWSARAAARHDRLTMPPGSLGRLLEIGRQLAGLQRNDRPIGAPALVVVCAADHGITAAVVSAYPAEVTGQMVLNYLRGGAAVNVLARRAGATVRVIDMGVAHWPEGFSPPVELHSHPIGRGTANFLDGPAMTRAEAFRAVRVGLELGHLWTRDGRAPVVALGEMGIGNTTSASALIALLTGAPAARVVGRGTGVDDSGYRRKVEAVERALTRHRDLPGDVWDQIARVGGFEILGLVGLAVASARNRSLVVLDGLISTAAGLIAARLCPALRECLLAAHVGPEPGHALALAALGLAPVLSLGLRLGEGTGAVLALPLIAAAADLLRDMATFDEAGVAGPAVATDL